LFLSQHFYPVKPLYLSFNWGQHIFINPTLKTVLRPFQSRRDSSLPHEIHFHDERSLPAIAFAQARPPAKQSEAGGQGGRI
jgi:hypothetical protein